MPKSKILLVDYDPRSIKQCKEVLINKLDCEVEVALDGIAALNLFPQIKPDLVIIEAMLPKKHGFEVCHEIKKSPQGKDIPVIIITHVYKGRKYRHQAFHIYCCDEYLEKPISDEFLIETVKRFLPRAKEAEPQPKKAQAPVEAKPKAQETITQDEEMVPVREDKAAVLSEKSSILAEDLEKEIASKVDEVLTLFSDVPEKEPSQPQESLQLEEVKVEEKPKKKKTAKKSKKEKKKKPEPVLSAVAKEQAGEEVFDSHTVKAEEDSDAPLEEAKSEAEIPREEEEAFEEEERDESSQMQEEEIAEQEEIHAAEKKIEEAIEEKLGSSEKFEALPEQESQEEIQQVQEEEIVKEEPIQEEAEVEAIEEVETTDEYKEEVLTSSPPKKSFFKSRTFFIGLAGIILLGIIFILFPVFKDKKDSTPSQAGVSIPTAPIKDEKPIDADLESSAFDTDTPPPDQMKEQMTTLEESGTAKTSKQLSQSKQSEATAKESTPSIKQKPKKAIKRESKKTVSVKTPLVTDKKQEKISSPPASKIKEKAPPTSTAISEKPKTSPVSKTVSPPAEEKKDIPSLAKQDLKEDSEKSLVQKEAIPLEKQAPVEEAPGPPQEQKVTQSSETAQKVSQDSQKQKDIAEEPPKQAPQPEESTPPQIGQLMDYSLLDREPPYLAHDPPKYPVLARLKGVEGQVTLKVLIKETGYVEEVKLIKGLDESVDKAAIKAVYKWVYRPPTSQGIRVKTWKTEILAFPPK